MSEWEYPPAPLESPIAREEGAGRPNSELKCLIRYVKNISRQKIRKKHPHNEISEN